MAAAHFTVSSGVKRILPKALIDYLWKLAVCENRQAYESQSFILEPRKLGGRNVQDIFHICDFDRSKEYRRVFGIEPVDCKLQVLNLQGNYQMLLSEN